MNSDQTNQQKVLKWSLIIGIVIVLNLFFNYALSLAYNSPEWEKFCEVNQVIEKIATKEECLINGGQWDENIYPPKTTEALREESSGYCNLYFSCQNDFEETKRIYDKNVFITLVILGVLSLALGMCFKNEIVSKSLSLGGVLSFIIASMRFWGSANDLIKLFILGVALVGLFTLAYKKFGK